MYVEDSEPLLLIPNGYPVWIDVPQATVGGLATAMRFVLPLHAHNLPLMHRQETKVIVALQGELEVRVGRERLAFLKEGEAVKLDAGVAHRIHQHGATPSTVGAVLCPGTVEQAFRELAALAARNGYQRDQMIEILARYNVFWATRSCEPDPRAVICKPLREWFSELPEPVARVLELKWGDWAKRIDPRL
jgi:mannose-6-phosphate isomerase-like protein (cupin superfamily)